MRLASTLGLALPLVLSFSALTPVLGERTAQEIVLDANRLLSEGQYSSAARAYGEAIGMSHLLLTGRSFLLFMAFLNSGS
jgi:hypothetical protein